MEYGIPALVLAALSGVGIGLAAVSVFNRIPPAWLCDYDEEPAPAMYGLRISPGKARFLMCVFFSGASLFLLRFGLLYRAVALLGLALLILIALADLKYRIIPDQFVLALAGIAFLLAAGEGRLPESLAAAAAGGGLLLFLSFSGARMAGKEVMGFGDIKLSAALGLLLGMPGILTTLLLGFLSAGFFFAAGILLRKVDPKEEQPFGPFLVGGAVFWLLFPETAARDAALYFGFL